MTENGFRMPLTEMRILPAVGLFLCVASATYANPALHLQKALKGKEAGQIYALLVAGSNTWMNYRHQVRATPFLLLLLVAIIFVTG